MSERILDTSIEIYFTFICKRSVKDSQSTLLSINLETGDKITDNKCVLLFKLNERIIFLYALRKIISPNRDTKKIEYNCCRKEKMSASTYRLNH